MFTSMHGTNLRTRWPCQRSFCEAERQNINAFWSEQPRQAHPPWSQDALRRHFSCSAINEEKYPETRAIIYSNDQCQILLSGILHTSEARLHFYSRGDYFLLLFFVIPDNSIVKSQIKEMCLQDCSLWIRIDCGFEYVHPFYGSWFKPGYKKCIRQR